MRSHEERVAETKRRIAKMEREKRLRRNTITMASAVAACLALLIGASLAMPGIAASIQTGDYSGFETAASIFHSGAALGYIVIGLLAFLLGVCVTVLCVRLRQMNREDGQNEESEDAHEQFGGQPLHDRKHRAPVDIGLVVPRRPRDVEAVPAAGIPLGPDAVQRQTDLRDNVGAQGLFRPGKRAQPIASRREKWYTDFIMV